MEGRKDVIEEGTEGRYMYKTNECKRQTEGRRMKKLHIRYSTCRLTDRKRRKLQKLQYLNIMIYCISMVVIFGEKDIVLSIFRPRDGNNSDCTLTNYTRHSTGPSFYTYY